MEAPFYKTICYACSIIKRTFVICMNEGSSRYSFAKVERIIVSPGKQFDVDIKIIFSTAASAADTKSRFYWMCDFGYFLERIRVTRNWLYFNYTLHFNQLMFYPDPNKTKPPHFGPLTVIEWGQFPA